MLSKIANLPCLLFLFLFLPFLSSSLLLLLRPLPLQLMKGTAEVYGTEMVVGKTYMLRATNIAVFSWKGATVKLSGTRTWKNKPRSPHTANPLEVWRDRAPNQCPPLKVARN